MRRVIGLAVAICVGLLAVPAIAAAAPAVPTADPFYSYSGSLAGVPPGAVLKTRTATFDELGVSIPLRTAQVLYRTTGELGQPTVTVATIIGPLVPVGATKLVSYQMAYDGMAANCDPSYAIQGGTPTESTNPLDQQLILTLATAGYTVVSADYEGEKLEFGAGHEAGYGTLDAIRAAETHLKLPTSTPVGLLGYSGGSIATDFAAELASIYAPQLNIVGAAMGGIPVDYAHNLGYINGSPTWGGAIPAVLVGLARAFKIDLSQYLSAYGLQVVRAASEFMGVGNADGTGDDVMVAADDEALAHTYCQRGLAVQFTEYKGDNHEAAALAFLPPALSFIEARLSGHAATDGCTSIGTGNSLATLPQPKTRWTLTVTPTHTGVRSSTRFTFMLQRTAGEVTTAYQGATIRLANRRATTNKAGRATITIALRGHHGTVYRARATVAGHRVATTTVTVRQT